MALLVMLLLVLMCAAGEEQSGQVGRRYSVATRYSDKQPVTLEESASEPRINSVYSVSASNNLEQQSLLSLVESYLDVIMEGDNVEQCFRYTSLEHVYTCDSTSSISSIEPTQDVALVTDHPGSPTDKYFAHFNMLVNLVKRGHTFKCPEEHGNYPVLSKCNQYVKCVGGEPHQMSCPLELHYNMATRECDFPARVKCPYTCPSENGDFPLFGDCSSYIQCSNGIPTLKGCENGLHWSKSKRQCDAPDLASCPLKCPQENGTFPYLDDCGAYILCQHGRPHLKKCPVGLYFSVVSLICEPQYPTLCPLEFQCPGRTGRFPVLGDCQMFLECNRELVVGNSSAALKKCPDGLLYNHATDQCDSANNTVCADQCPQSDGIFEIAGLCSYYKICNDGVPMLQMCNNGLHFNPVQKQCDWPAAAGCVTKCTKDNVAMPVPGKCNQYIVCVDGVAEVNYCPANLHWNQLLGLCDMPSNSNCKLQCPEKFGRFPIPGQCTNYISCMDGTPTLKRCPENLHFNNRIKTCDFPEDAKCAITCPEPDGTFPVDGHCSAFIKCSRNQPTISSCDDGHHFNFVTAQCDLPENVSCEPQCPFPNGRFTLPGRPTEWFMECINNSSVIRICSSGLRLDPVTETCSF